MDMAQVYTGKGIIVLMINIANLTHSDQLLNSIEKDKILMPNSCNASRVGTYISLKWFSNSVYPLLCDGFMWHTY